MKVWAQYKARNILIYSWSDYLFVKDVNALSYSGTLSLLI